MKLNQLSRKHRQTAGFSLVEFLIGNSLGLVAMSTLAALSLFTSRSFVAIGNYNDLERNSSVALDTLSREVRGAQQLLSFATNRIELRNTAGQTVTYQYSSGTRSMTRQVGSGQPTVLLSGCDFLRFNMSQRNPSNDFTFYPASTAAEAKLVDVSWRCSRRVLGNQINTESVQTAKIVIRN